MQCVWFCLPIDAHRRRPMPRPWDTARPFEFSNLRSRPVAYLSGLDLPDGEALRKFSELLYGPLDAWCPCLPAVQSDEVTEAPFCRRKQIARLDADTCR